MSSVQLIAVETALLVSTVALNGWLLGRTHEIAIQVYAGVAQGVRLSRETRFLTFSTVWGGYVFYAIALNGLVALALVQIATSTTSSEAANVAYLFASVLALAVPYLVVICTMVVFSMSKMIRRGLRGEPVQR